MRLIWQPWHIEKVPSASPKCSLYSRDSLAITTLNCISNIMLPSTVSCPFNLFLNTPTQAGWHAAGYVSPHDSHVLICVYITGSRYAYVHVHNLLVATKILKLIPLDQQKLLTKCILKSTVSDTNWNVKQNWNDRCGHCADSIEPTIASNGRVDLKPQNSYYKLLLFSYWN